MKRVRFASAMRSAEGRHSSLIAGSGAILQRLVVRPGAALGRSPGDDPVGILDVAGLAVHAICGVDLQAAGAVLVLEDLVHGRGTEPRARVAVFARATIRANTGVGHVQVDWLLLI